MYDYVWVTVAMLIFYYIGILSDNNNIIDDDNRIDINNMNSNNHYDNSNNQYNYFKEISTHEL